MTETAATALGRFAAAATDPVSLAVIALAGVAVLGILVATNGRRARSEADDAPLRPTQPVPLLETPMQPVLAAPRRVARGAGRTLPVFTAFAFGLVGFVMFAGLIALGLKLVGGAPPERAVAQNGSWTDDAVIAAAAEGCAGGVGDHRDSYTMCGAGVPVTFEVVGLARGGERLVDAAWSGARRRAFVLTAHGQPAPFTLDRKAGILPAPGAALSDYDAYVAVGYADAASDGDAAEARAEARGLALADLALRQARDGDPRDCRSDVMVHAVSLGARRGEAGPAPAPLLVGVRLHDRINRPGGDAGELTAMLDGLFAGPGAVITGLDPAAYGPWEVLSSQRACDRSPV